MNMHNSVEIATESNFDAERYLAANPDVRAAGVPARLHFDLFGRREGRTQVAVQPDAAAFRISVVGNCQAPVLALCLRAMLPDVEIHGLHLGISSTEVVGTSDIIFLQTEFSNLKNDHAFISEDKIQKVKLWPTFYHAGFHPDLVYARAGGASLKSPMHDYNSALTLYGWSRGLTVQQTLNLFCEDVFDRLGYFTYAASSDARFVEDCSQAGLDGEALLTALKRDAPFCHAVNHPKLAAMAHIAESVLRSVDLAPSAHNVGRFLGDPLLSGPVWPLYPEIADRLCLEGSYDFKTAGVPGRILDLERFVAGSFDLYRGREPSDISCDRLEAQSDLYRDLENLVVSGRRRGSNPYAKLPDHHFWRRAVADVAPADLDPVIAPKFRLSVDERIATAGSCFAQHIARTLIDRGFNYHVTERGSDGLDLFSARFGNIYSARQLLQLARRAYGLFEPHDTAWRRPDGRYVDPFRPQVDPAGHASEEEVIAALADHLAAVRRMFDESDLFIFTIGLTEIWESIGDGAVFPLAPGVVARPPDPSLYRFANMTAEEVRRDLEAFIAFIRTRNPDLKILFTVSPVPLVATYENRHVLVSTIYSKSALRAAVGEICQKHHNVDYFPSYEIITSSANSFTYFESDLRSVTDSGVAHVMRVFDRHYMGRAPEPKVGQDASLRAEFARSSKILCDEEALDATN
ncbi:GSCFA family protein [Methylobacterium sp. 275MFSha3.1]|uniref:GSCFA domain-containing protein n=1 Tax=Methylobacterium sp. 275MFSha3.1 TaxID=1502746 RepID=UPI0008A753D1|nr:GSCFA domain-containing protein [Methylobacterium sp. 275MFSha3.1]SEI13014.1 GSCFA family protein [Methylobacterium sp. 275MFSha3.1]